jgi:hypothetical protein
MVFAILKSTSGNYRRGPAPGAPILFIREPIRKGKAPRDLERRRQ